MAQLSVAAAAAKDVNGMLLLALSELLLSVVNVIVKWVADWSAVQVMVVRYSIDFILCFSYCAAMGHSVPKGSVALRLLLRGMAYCAFILTLWQALKSCLPLGDVVVVVVAVSPIFLVMLTFVFLGEKIPRLWPVQFALCVLGAIMVNKPMAPHQGCSPWAALMPVASGFFGALMNFMSRQLKDVPAPVVCIYNDFSAVIFASSVLATSAGSGNFLPALSWKLGLVVISAFVGWLGLMANVKGYQSVSVAAVASIASYTSVPLGYAMQTFVFGQTPDVWSLLGATLIACTNIGVSISKFYASQDSDPKQAVTVAGSKQPLLDPSHVEDKVEEPAVGA